MKGIVVAYKTTPEAIPLRRELVATTRHILTTSLRTLFYNDLEVSPHFSVTVLPSFNLC
jgi:hypothetical protein